MFKTALNNYNKLSEELKNARETREAIDKTTKKLILDGDIEAYKAYKEATEADFLNACEDEHILSLAMYFAKENLRIAYCADTLPEVLAILAKYTGKRIGEKTAERISTEAKERLGCREHFAKVSTFNTRLPKGVGNVKPEAWSLYLSF